MGLSDQSGISSTLRMWWVTFFWSLINTLYRYRIYHDRPDRYHQLYPYPWQRSGMSFQSCHRTETITLLISTQTLPKHCWSAHMDSFNIEIQWCDLPHLCAGALHCKTNRETCQSGIELWDIQWSHPTSRTGTSHQHALNWEQDICIWCQLCRWPTVGTRKSQQGHLIMYNSAPIIRKNNRQRTITLSTSEAELDSFSSCVRSVLHTMKILKRMGSPLDEVNMFEDNCSTIAICTNMSPGNSRTKLVDLKLKWFLEDLVGRSEDLRIRVNHGSRLKRI